MSKTRRAYHDETNDDKVYDPHIYQQYKQHKKEKKLVRALKILDVNRLMDLEDDSD